MAMEMEMEMEMEKVEMGDGLHFRGLSVDCCLLWDRNRMAGIHRRHHYQPMAMAGIAAVQVLPHIQMSLIDLSVVS